MQTTLGQVKKTVEPNERMTNEAPDEKSRKGDGSKSVDTVDQKKTMTSLPVRRLFYFISGTKVFSSDHAWLAKTCPPSFPFMHHFSRLAASLRKFLAVTSNPSGFS